MKLLLKHPDERGQGLVEYALILVLVAIVVIAILLLMGPEVSQVYCRVANSLQPGSCGALKTVTAVRTGFGHGDDVVVFMTVKQSTSVTVSDSQSGKSATTSCNGSCTVTITNVGHHSGTMTATDNVGGSLSAPYGHHW